MRSNAVHAEGLSLTCCGGHSGIAAQRGFAALWGVILLTALIGFASLAVDYGRVRLAQGQLQDAVDAAARYAAKGLGDGTAASKAITLAGENLVDGQPLTLLSGDVETGTWDDVTKAFTPGGGSPNAVRVTGRRTAARGNALPTPLAKVMGFDGFNLEYSAIATASGSGIEPIVLYLFDETSGTTAYDSSTFETPLNLSIWQSWNTEWGYGRLRFTGTSKARTSSAATKVITALKATNRLTVYVRIRTDNTWQSGPVRFITLSSDTTNRNFMLGQDGTSIAARLRTQGGASPGDANGMNELKTSGVLTDFPDYFDIAMTYTGSQYRIIRRKNTGSKVTTSMTRTGTFNNWNTGYRLIVGNEETNDRQWRGRIYAAAIYDVELSSEQLDEVFAGNYYPGGSGGGGGAGGAVTTVK